MANNNTELKIEEMIIGFLNDHPTEEFNPAAIVEKLCIQYNITTATLSRLNKRNQILRSSRGFYSIPAAKSSKEGGLESIHDVMRRTLDRRIHDLKQIGYDLDETAGTITSEWVIDRETISLIIKTPKDKVQRTHDDYSRVHSNNELLYNPELTRSENKVLRLISEEQLTPKQIAIRRKCRIRVVYKHLKNIREKGINYESPREEQPHNENNADNIAKLYEIVVGHDKVIQELKEHRNRSEDEKDARAIKDKEHLRRKRLEELEALRGG